MKSKNKKDIMKSKNKKMTFE